MSVKESAENKGKSKYDIFKETDNLRRALSLKNGTSRAHKIVGVAHDSKQLYHSNKHTRVTDHLA